MDWILFFYMDILGIFAATCSTSASVPQLCSKTPQTLRPWSIILRCVGGISWTLYGALKSDYPLMMASAIVAAIEIILYCQRHRALAHQALRDSLPTQPGSLTSDSHESGKHKSCE
jgi:uncharacterized protein with PQ loop repeat